MRFKPIIFCVWKDPRNRSFFMPNWLKNELQQNENHESQWLYSVRSIFLIYS